MKTIKLTITIVSLFQCLLLFPVSTKAEELSLHSESAILLDAKTGLVLYEKNSHVQMYPASITKLVTAIVAIEESNLSDEVVVSENARNVEGTRVYLEEGEIVTVDKLLQGLMINSGNDAGVAIAEHMHGTVEGFAEHMNAFVQEKVVVTDTSFKNPHGLFHEEHYTTAYDMAQIMRYGMKNEEFKKLISIKSMPWKGQSWETVLYTHHRMMLDLPYEGVIGGKNGYVQKSGFTLVTVAQRGETQLIAVTMKATGKKQPYQDTKTLFDYGFKHFDTSRIPESLYVDVNQTLPEDMKQEIETQNMERIESEQKGNEDSRSASLILPLTLIGMISLFFIIKFRQKKQYRFK
ncbi:D-alanyl-D-alanine carboxypeptidase family protein [Bacillus pinisoli]|uniref:D-alanyl-D-alanine carboxypeptidase family protein n=1 Tax=Bacillus pinisoli TaxID=2901866 RepID=UPI001FF44326|nr:D-alanyl-D-alanine carboxypeptidase family protein [Bacillus pinisoli]